MHFEKFLEEKRKKLIITFILGRVAAEKNVPATLTDIKYRLK